MVTTEEKGTRLRIYRQGAVVVFQLGGPFTAEFLQRLDEALEREIGNAVPRVVGDLAEVTLVDSAALEWLLDRQEGWRRSGGDLKLARPTELVADILRITGLDTIVEIYDSVPRAVGSYAL